MSGDTLSPRVVFDLGISVDSVNVGDVLSVKGNFSTTINSSNVTSFSFQIGVGIDKSFTNIISYNIMGDFLKTYTITQDFKNNHSGKTIRLRLYACYQGNVTPSDYSTFSNMFASVGTDFNGVYFPHISAVDSVAREMGLMSRDTIRNSSNVNLNNFITPGTWAITDTSNTPGNWPETSLGGRIIVFATGSSSSFSTVQIVFDRFGKMFYRYSSSSDIWTEWKNFDFQIKDSTIYSYGNIIEPGLNMNEGDFIHPGFWAVIDTNNLPKNCPTTYPCRIVSVASTSNNTIFTWQFVLDSTGQKYERFSTNTGVWGNWSNTIPKHRDIAFSLDYTSSDPFIGADDIEYDNLTTGRVERLLSQYNSVTPKTGVFVNKESLGMDASNTYPVWNYKISNRTGEKPIVLVIVGEHGNEPNSAILGYYLYKEILDGELTKYLKFVDFWVIPLMNPWGYENSDRNNSNGVNLNRDFPAEWSYSEVQHNVTGNYSLSQPETQYIYNLLIENIDKILFICNKHDTGSISRKLLRDEEDIVGYVSSMLETDSIVNRGIVRWQNHQVRETDSWIVDDCSIDISNKQLFAARNLLTPGSLDVFANSIGIHGSLLELSYGCYEGEETNYYPSSWEESNPKDRKRKETARLGLDFFVNYISKTLEKNSIILEKDTLVGGIRWFTREYDSSLDTWNTVEMYWNGSELVT